MIIMIMIIMCIYIYIYVYIYIYIHMCVCVCVCVCALAVDFFETCSRVVFASSFFDVWNLFDFFWLLIYFFETCLKLAGGWLTGFVLSPYRTSKSPSQPGGSPPFAAGLRWIVKKCAFAVVLVLTYNDLCDVALAVYVVTGQVYYMCLYNYSIVACKL